MEDGRKKGQSRMGQGTQIDSQLAVSGSFQWDQMNANKSMKAFQKKNLQQRAPISIQSVILTHSIMQITDNLGARQNPYVLWGISSARQIFSMKVTHRRAMPAGSNRLLSTSSLSLSRSRFSVYQGHMIKFTCREKQHIQTAKLMFVR